jgi:hypothetical protein
MQPSFQLAEVFIGTAADSVALHRKVEAGRIRRIARGLYTPISRPISRQSSHEICGASST